MHKGIAKTTLKEVKEAMELVSTKICHNQNQSGRRENSKGGGRRSGGGNTRSLTRILGKTFLITVQDL